MLRSLRRTMGQLLLIAGLLAGTTLLPGTTPPAAAAGPTRGGVNPCVVLEVCVVVTSPGSSPTPGSGGGGGTGSGGGGGPAMCSWNGQQWPCWDPDYGWFDSSSGCYFDELSPQPDPGDPLWGGHSSSDGAVYAKACALTGGGLEVESPVWLAKPPGVGQAPPDPGTVAQMAVKQLKFAKPVVHTAPAGTALVGVPVWFWYETSAADQDQTVGPQSTTVSLNGLSVTATARLDHVLWDLGYVDPTTGQEAVLDCGGPGVPYQPGLEQDVPAGACTRTFSKATTPTAGASAAAGGTAGFYLTATEYWTVSSWNNTAGDQAYPDLTITVASDPIGLSVNELQVLN
ncbi:hypothetical protein ACIGXM_18520 [Kitasatospora sp. NPDC052896]|uniref:hypothetical protein n=1 Tax=Kitasatospora sp. NPDC052896 TaxID=3364061 RepID=UPI0037C80AD7